MSAALASDGEFAGGRDGEVLGEGGREIIQR